jgi:predicted alpha/beta hydrolase
VLALVDHHLIDRSILVATGNGYYQHNTAGLRRKAPFLWRVVVPASTVLVGYFPGRRLRIVGDLPAGVARQWGRWCLHPDYWGADVPDIVERHAAVEHPVTLLTFTDDEILTESGLWAFTDQLSSAPVEAVLLGPADLGVERVGHHGFFRRHMTSAWRELLLPRLAGSDR